MKVVITFFVLCLICIFSILLQLEKVIMLSYIGASIVALTSIITDFYNWRKK